MSTPLQSPAAALHTLPLRRAAAALWRRRALVVTLVTAASVLGACGEDANTKAEVGATDVTDDGAVTDSSGDSAVSDTATDSNAGPAAPAFKRGCPTSGKSLVRKLVAGETFHGPAALAAPGDWMLANSHAAFVVKAPTETEHTYAHYGGLLVDAVALVGCAQAAPERFGELLLLLGTINIGDLPASTLRTFRGTSAVVLADGSDGGAAKLRVHGVDDYFWLVELTLIAEAWRDGKPKKRSLPLGVKLALDYTLPPDRASIQVDLVVINETSAKREFHVGAAAFVDDSTEQQIWSKGKLAAGGFSLRTGMPWLAGSARDGAIVIAVDTNNLGTAQISGVDALVPIHQLAEPLTVGPKGSATGEDRQRFWIGVGATDSASAVATLEGIAVGGESWTGVDVAGHVVDIGDKTGVSDARVVLERRTNAGDYEPLLSERSGPGGAFSLRVPKVGAKDDLRLVAHAAGRDPSAPVVLSLDGKDGDVQLRIGEAGRIEHEVVDGEGKLLPARLTLVHKQTKATLLGFAAGTQGAWPVPPGSYTLIVTHGYTHTPWQGEVTVVAGKPAVVKATLPQVVQHAGWMSFDNHVHSQPSPDSTVPLADRYIAAAAEGLHIVVHSEHEIIVDSGPHLQASGVGAWVRGVTGQEVTASLPEHTNMTSVKPDPSHKRGAPVKWHGRDLAEIWALEKTRGAGFRTLNHPRKGCNWLCLIGWDRQQLTWTNDEPESVGLAQGATMFSWDFEAIETMNGMDSRLFVEAGKEDETGTFEDWLSFHNAGHLITGLAVTDVHGWAPPGSPRTWFRVPKDDLSAFSDAWLVDAVKAGHTVMSAGAFAEVSIGAAGPGELAKQGALQDGKAPVKVRVQAIAAVDVTRLVVVVNCVAVAEVQATKPNEVVKFDGVIDVPLSEDSHVVVVGFGAKPMPAGLKSYNPTKVPRFISNPIRVDVDGDGAWTPPGGRACTVQVSK